MRSEWLVYWLYDDACVCYARHGCIGATKATRLYTRMNQHQHSRRIPKNFRYAIIFRGSQKRALALEAALRPHPYIGWNIGIGGFANGGGLRGLPKPPEQREKIRQAALARYAKPGEKERTAKAVKKAFRHIDRTGANNSHFGKPTSEATKQKMRDKIAERGGVAGPNNPNFKHGRYCE